MGYVVVVAALFGIQNMLFSFVHSQRIRAKVFNEDWTKENLEGMHQSFMGKDAPAPFMGYPDNGAGIYSRMLSYKHWFEFNCAQRVHNNNIEHLTWNMPMLLVNGFFFPRITAALGSVVLGGRELYRVGYMSPEGPTSKIREMGAMPLNIAELLMLLSMTGIFIRYQFGGLLRNRNFYKRLT